MKELFPVLALYKKRNKNVAHPHRLSYDTARDE
jgi:hypothetical protein